MWDKIIWGTDVQPNVNAMESIYCNTSFCYGAHDGGYLSKIYKNDSIIVQASYMCSSGMDADWIITDAQVCVML